MGKGSDSEVVALSQILMEHRDSKPQRIRVATGGTLYSSAAQAIKQIPKDVPYGFLRFQNAQLL